MAGKRVPLGPIPVLGLSLLTGAIVNEEQTFSVMSIPRTYSCDADLGVEGNSLYLRPWQLPHRADYGLRGTSDGDLLSVVFFVDKYFQPFFPTNILFTDGI